MQNYKKRPAVEDMSIDQIVRRLQCIFKDGDILEVVVKKYKARKQYLLLDVNTIEKYFIVSSGLTTKFKKILFDEVREVGVCPALFDSPFHKKLAAFKLLYESGNSKNATTNPLDDLIFYEYHTKL